MGRYPVIFVSLKGINAATYDKAFNFAVQIMQRTAEEFQFLSDSECLSVLIFNVFPKRLGRVNRFTIPPLRSSSEISPVLST